VNNTFSDLISILSFFGLVLKDQCKKLLVDLCIFRLKRSQWDAAAGVAYCSIESDGFNPLKAQNTRPYPNYLCHMNQRNKLSLMVENVFEKKKPTCY
jgi:hypothetical protein